MKNWIIGIFLTLLVLLIMRSIQKGTNPYRTIVETVSDAAQLARRGTRNNNPGNIRISANNWRGKVPVEKNTDGVFEQFETPEDGIRALGILLRNYGVKYSDNTIARIVARYAPSNENDTGAYIAAVSNYTGIVPAARLDLIQDNNALRAVVAGIIKQENGIQPYTEETLTRALA